MPKTVSIGQQDFESIIKNGYFYVEKPISSKNGGKTATA